MAVERKYERDIDLLLAEELEVNAAFALWLKARTKFSGNEGTIAGVFVSRSDNLGESDLVAVYRRPDGTCFAILIEDKVDAPIQPDQASRYRLRAERSIQRGEFDAFTVILCAPAFYIDNSTGAGSFDGTVSFEDIADCLAEDDSPRSRYRAAFLRTAAVRRVNNWVREVDDATESFWRAAYEIAAKEFPILEMKPLKVTKGSSWINFRPHFMPTMPRRIYVSVKGDRGFMDLTFSGTSCDIFHDLVAHLLESDMTVHQTAASTAIRLQTSGFTPEDGLENGVPKVRKAFESCSRLIRFYRTNRVALDEAVEKARVPVGAQFPL